MRSATRSSGRCRGRGARQKAVLVGGRWARCPAAWLDEEPSADVARWPPTGPAVIRAISELETGPAAPRRAATPPTSRRRRSGRGGSCRRGTGRPREGTGPGDCIPRRHPPPPQPRTRTSRELLARVPAVADALPGSRPTVAQELRDLAKATARAYDDDVIGYWARTLLSPRAPSGRDPGRCAVLRGGQRGGVAVGR